jgi:hypothetical protein
MDQCDVDRIKHAVNVDAVRRMLIKYFVTKGHTNDFNRLLYPADLMDMPMAIPQLMNKLEIVPHALDLDQTTGRATLGWNLFMLGTSRMYLGETIHDNLTDLARQIRGGMINGGSRRTAKRQTTPKRIVNFILRVLSSSEAGYVDLVPAARSGAPGDALTSKGMLMGMPQQMYGNSGRPF